MISGREAVRVGRQRPLGVMMPIISQWPVVVSIPEAPLAAAGRRPRARRARGGQPRSGMMFPRPRACSAGTLEPADGLGDVPSVEEPAVAEVGGVGQVARAHGVQHDHACPWHRRTLPPPAG